jgi:hypothetical protein
MVRTILVELADVVAELGQFVVGQLRDQSAI